MIKKADIIQMAKRIARRSSGRSDLRVMHPVRDWIIGLALGTTVFIGGSIYAGTVFLAELHNTDTTYTATVETATYKHDLVDEVLTIYRERAGMFNELRADRSFVVIPPVVDEEMTATSSETVAEEEISAVE